MSLALPEVWYAFTDILIYSMLPPRASLILMQLWKLLAFVIAYSIVVFPTKVRHFVKKLRSDYCDQFYINLRFFGPLPMARDGGPGVDDQSWCQSHHCTLSMHPFVCPIFWEFATNLSRILYPNHRLFCESKELWTCIWSIKRWS